MSVLDRLQCDGKNSNEIRAECQCALRSCSPCPSPLTSHVSELSLRRPGTPPKVRPGREEDASQARHASKSAHWPREGRIASMDCTVKPDWVATAPFSLTAFEDESLEERKVNKRNLSQCCTTITSRPGHWLDIRSSPWCNCGSSLKMKLNMWSDHPLACKSECEMQRC